MTRPSRFEHHRYLGDKRTRLVHDLDQAGEACDIPGLMASERFAAFGPDTQAEARNRGFRPCGRCAAPALSPSEGGQPAG